jgi:hypothetical protein
VLSYFSPLASLISWRPSSTIRCACLGWASLVRFGHFQRKTYRWFLMRARCFRVAPLALARMVRTVLSPREVSSAIQRSDLPALRSLRTVA